MADVRVGGRYQGRHRGRHRAPTPPLWQRIERPGAGALAALGVATMVTAVGSRPQQTATDQGTPQARTSSVLAASIFDRGGDSQRASRDQQRASVVLGAPDSGTTSAPLAAPSDVAPSAAVATDVAAADLSATGVGLLPVPEPPAPVVKAAPKPAATKPSTPPTVTPPGGVGPVDPAYAAAAARIGLRGNAILVYAAVRAQFGITTIGGYRAGDMDHGTGHAVDVMVGGNSGLGDAVAAYVLANRGSFNVKYIIWKQRIWLPEFGYWRPMADRGSVTANHYDHVHVSVN